MHMSDALLIGVLFAIVTHHHLLRHGPRASHISSMCVVDCKGNMCTYAPCPID